MIPRYARPAMTAIWEPDNKYRIWFEIEAHACDAQAKLGVIPAEAAGGALRCRFRTVDDAAAVFLITGLSRQAGAQMLGLPLAAIDERISAGTLLALSDGAETRLLVTQFHANRELPGLSTVLSAFPDGTDAAIAGLWLILPNPDLADIDGNDELLPALSPRDFLINGGNPARVALLANALDRSVS